MITLIRKPPCGSLPAARRLVNPANVARCWSSSAAGLIAMVGMVGLVIDVGNAWGQQRDSQNASDSASEAGALLIAQNLPFLAADPPQTVPNNNSDVAAAVIAALDANDVTIEEAWYTNFTGVRVGRRTAHRSWRSLRRERSSGRCRRRRGDELEGVRHLHRPHLRHR